MSTRPLFACFQWTSLFLACRTGLGPLPVHSVPPLSSEPQVDQVDVMATAYLPTCLLLLVGSTCAADSSPTFPLPASAPIPAPSHTPAPWVPSQPQLNLYFLAIQRGMQDLSSLTSDETLAPCVEAQVNLQGVPTVFPCNLFYFCGIHNVPLSFSDCWVFLCEFFCL